MCVCVCVSGEGGGGENVHGNSPDGKERSFLWKKSGKEEGSKTQIWKEHIFNFVCQIIEELLLWNLDRSD